MTPRPKILVIGSPIGLVEQSLWEHFQSRYNVRQYEFPTANDFHESINSGDCRDVAGIVRLGLNIPPGIEKLGQGWTKRGLPYFPKSLKIIVNFGHGYDEEDIVALSDKGIQFFNTPGGDEATAVVGMYLIISAFRQLGRYERMLREGDFLQALRDSAKNAVDPFGKHIGIVGMGAIGQAVAQHAAAFGMQVHSLDRPNLRAILADEKRARPPSLSAIVLNNGMEEMVQEVDCIVLACSYTPETHHILSRKIFSGMKRGMRIVNIARGKCIEEDALCDAIRTGIVSGVGLDVHYNEPSVNPALLEYPCVTLLPHLGGLTSGSMKNHAEIALKRADAFFQEHKDES